MTGKPVKEGTQDRQSSPARVLTRKWRLLGVLGLACFGVAVVAWLIGFVFFANMLTPSRLPPQAADGIVVLTGGDSRLNEAMRLLTQNKGQRLLISGVNPTATDADIKSLFDNADTLFDCCVDLDRSAADTIGNASETARWVTEHGYGSVIVVTANYHMPRSLLEFRHAMPSVAFIPYAIESDARPVRNWWLRPATAVFLISEYNKFLLTLLRIRTLSLFS